MSDSPNSFYSSLQTDLIWNCLKKDASFLVKQKAGKPVLFSKEALNPTNRHLYSYSGLLNDKAINIDFDQNHKKIIVLMKDGLETNRNRPCNSIKRIDYTLKSCVIQRIKKLMQRKGYPLHLQEMVIFRANLFLQKNQKPLLPKKQRGKKC